VRTLFLTRNSAAILIAIVLAQPATAGPVSFSVAGDYVDARRIRQHHFIACRNRRVNEWSRTACPFWEPITSGQTVDLLGGFCVYAEWDANRLYRGSFTVPIGSRGYALRVRPNPSTNKGDCP